ncbi:hypothetical protein QQF64_006515 [Cirrhinus molitorella]|uniref:Uncharacterized protein n=1 Tax=Cirrhinus molitorella TaxID=172907 RepID=A0ABR3M9F6_9TELE
MSSWGSQTDLADELKKGLSLSRSSVRDESELLEDDVVSLTSSDPGASALLGSTQEEQEMSEGEEAEAEPSQTSCPAYEELLEVMDRATSLEIDIRRECLLKCLIMYLGEDTSCLIKEYQVMLTRGRKKRENLQKTTMAFFVIRESDALSRALDISIVIDGVEVLNELPSVACACACAMMFGLIYALNLKYPEGLRYTL